MGISDSFKALSDPIRREILFLLKDDPMTAGEIADKVNMSQAAVSYHLAQLKKADMVFSYNYKNFVYYENNKTIFEEIIVWLIQLKEKEEK